MKTKLFFLASVLLGFFLAACQDDRMQEEPSGKGKVFPAVNMEDLSAAMQWYEMHQMEQYATRAGKRHPLFEEVIPDWTSSYSGENSDGRTVETYLGVLNPGIYVAEDASQAYRETKDPRYLTGLSRLVVLFPQGDAEAMGFYMTIVPSKAYLEKTDFRPFKNNSYTVRDRELDGYVLYHSLDGQLINGWVYEKGKITLAIYGTSHSAESTPQTRAGTKLCIPHYEYYCTDYFYTVNGGDPIYNGRVCTDDILVGLDCSDGGSEGVRPGGGGGIGGLPPLRGLSTTHMSEKLKKLFKGHDNVPREAIELLNDILDSILAKDCVSKQIYDYLLTKERFDTIKFVQDAQNLASTGSQGSRLTITNPFDLSITEKNISHEMIHMFQVRYQTKKLVKIDLGMMEFEAALFQDLCRYVRLKGEWDNDENQNDWACWGGAGAGADKNKKDYMEWLDDLTQKGTSLPTSINNGKFSDWSVKFGKYSTQYPDTKYTYGVPWVISLPGIVSQINTNNCLKK